MNIEQELRRTQDRMQEVLSRLRVVETHTMELPSRLKMGGGGGLGITHYANYAAFPAVTSADDGVMAYADDLDHVYIVRAGRWRVWPHFEMTTTPTGIGEYEGDEWYQPTSGIGWWYVAPGGISLWVRLTHYKP